MSHATAWSATLARMLRRRKTELSLMSFRKMTMPFSFGSGFLQGAFSLETSGLEENFQKFPNGKIVILSVNLPTMLQILVSWVLFPSASEYREAWTHGELQMLYRCVQSQGGTMTGKESPTPLSPALTCLHSIVQTGKGEPLVPFFFEQYTVCFKNSNPCMQIIIDFLVEMLLKCIGS